MAEIVTKRCEHLLKFEGMTHGHVIVLDRETQYIMCDHCYAKLCQRLFADQAPKTWLDNPLIEPDKMCHDPLKEWKRSDPY